MKKRLVRINGRTVYRAALAGALVLALGLFLGGCPQPTDEGGSSARELAEDFKAGQGEVFEKTTDTVGLADEAAVDAALADYAELSDEVKALLAEEKAQLDSLKVKITELRAAANAAEQAATFKTGQSEVLGKTVDTVSLADEAAVTAALTAYAGLSAEVKALLTTEKTKLDGLSAKIAELKATAGADELAGAFRTWHSGVLGKTADTVAASDETAVNAALTAYEALSAEVKALLTEEKATLDSLSAKIETLKPDTTAPAAVTNLTGTVDNGQVSLTWTDPADADFDHIEITWADGPVLNVDQGEETRTITGLTNDVAYTFIVKAVDSSGNKASGETITLTPRIPLSDVSGLSASIGSAQVILNWTDPPSADLDHIEISWTAGAGGSETVSKSVQTCSITGLTNDVAYTFTVKAVDTSNNSSGGRQIILSPSPLHSWTLATATGFSGDCKGVAWNGSGKLVAVGGSTISVSTNGGLTWSSVAHGLSIGLQNITWCDGKFIASGGNGVIVYSSDGSTWYKIEGASTTFESAQVNDIAWGNNTFVAVGNSGKMARSSNGTTWTAVEDSAFGSTDFIRGIAWGNDKFVAVGYDASGSGKMAYSSDGTTWTAVADSALGTESIMDIIWADNKFTAVGGTNNVGGKIAWSSDGITWTAVADTKYGTSTINGVTWAGTRFVTGGRSAKITYSEEAL
jgi:hypothetical protein